MALNAKFAVQYRNVCLDQFDALTNGFMKYYDGTQPADSDTALGSQVLLAQLTFGATAFAAAAAGSKTANAITQDSSADASGTCTWVTLQKSTGIRSGSMLDGSVGTSAANVVMNTVAITAGNPVSCSSLVISMAA